MEILVILGMGAVAYWLVRVVVNVWGRHSVYKAGEREIRKQYERGELDDLIRR